jgi:hypothetical protein
VTIRSGASRSSGAFPVAATPAAGALIEAKFISARNIEWSERPSERTPAENDYGFDVYAVAADAFGSDVMSHSRVENGR